MNKKTSKNSSKLVFLVDDDANILETINTFLIDEGIEVETSRNALEAVKRIEGGLIYDLLIVDRNMQGLEDGGDEVARISKLTSPNIPVFALSGYRDDYNRKDFNDYFKKPIDPELLVWSVRQKMGLNR